MEFQAVGIESYPFCFNKGVLGIDFKNTPKEVCIHLGKPYFKVKYDDGNVMYEYRLIDNTLYLFFHFNDGQFDYLSIHLKRLIILNQDISKLSEKELINLLMRYHKTHSLNFKLEREINEQENVFFFPNIGLTVWFEKDQIVDICIDALYS